LSATSSVVAITVLAPIQLHGENDPGNQFRLWFDAPNGIYIIDASADLRTWTPVQTNAALNNRFQWLDNRSLPRRFYRARAQ
jgi:hypothetical protein